MIVCLCYGIDESKIEDLVSQGTDSLCSIGRVCGAGTDCGGCRARIEEIIIEEAGEAEAHCPKRHLRVA